MDESPVDLVLLTGFLGTGKTTLLNRLLADLRDGETGVLVNDFGPVAVDGGRLAAVDGAESLEIYEVKDGSIFCSCKSADFVLGLRMFARLKPRRLIVEASGLADPRGMRKILDDNRLSEAFTIALTACLVDPTASYKLRRALPVIDEQIGTADILVVNKQDLASAEELRLTSRLLDELNPEALRLTTSYGRIDPALLTDRERAARAAGLLEECRLPGEGPQALFFETGAVSRPRLSGFLEERKASLLRLKGWYSFPEEVGEWWYVSDNSGRLEWTREALPPGQSPGLVAICPAGAAERVADEWRSLIDPEVQGEDT